MVKEKKILEKPTLSPEKLTGGAVFRNNVEERKISFSRHLIHVYEISQIS